MSEQELWHVSLINLVCVQSSCCQARGGPFYFTVGIDELNVHMVAIYYDDQTSLGAHLIISVDAIPEPLFIFDKNSPS
jgi:hypothetical protein